MSRKRTPPVSVSTSTTAMCAPLGKVPPACAKSPMPSSRSPSRDADANTSTHPTEMAGVPTTWKRPSSSVTSVTSASNNRAAISRALSATTPDARHTFVPPNCTDREPPVISLLGTRSVSPWMTVTLWNGTPRRSATSIAQVVRCPCPYGVVPVITRAATSPDSSRSTSTMPSSDPPDIAVISTYTATPIPICTRSPASRRRRCSARKLS